MCGIAGLVNLNGTPASPSALAAMTDALAHRGPDGSGIEIRGQVGLGHRRLAIIDLQTGQQPLANEDERIWITFNGEIYNYRELRRQLLSKGHEFRTSSDTETIVHAYEEWGDDCVKQLRGMFAFGIADFRRHRLLLARDHLGIKPLYYLARPDCVAFASELQSVRRAVDSKLTLDLQALDQYLRLRYIPAPRTIFQEIRKLPPASYLSVTFDGQVSPIQEYWRPEFRPDYSRTESDWLEAIDEVLRESVLAHTVSDVPFGAFLSGGVDSSAIVAYMSQVLERPVRTFSIGFDEPDYSEIAYAEQAANRWGTEHHVEIVKPDALAILPALVKHYGEPFGDNSAIPTFYVSQLARRSVPMVLSGDGGDEAFAGYDSYLSWMSWLSKDDLAQAHRPTWKRILSPLVERIFPNRYPPLPSREPVLQTWLTFVTFLGKLRRQSLWRPEYRNMSATPLEVFEREFAHTHEYSSSSRVQYMDLRTYLPSDILTKVDIATMMHGLEARTPLVDIRVIEFAGTIPEDINIGRNSSGEWEGKLLLKKAMRRYYPVEFVQRPKMGFAMPFRAWFGQNPAVREEVCQRLLEPNSTLLEFFEPSAIRGLVDSNSTGPIWLLLFLEEWLRQNRSNSTL